MPATPGESRLVLAFDFGTSSVKVGAFDHSGGMIATGTSPYTVRYPQSGWAEQDPSDWWNAVGAACRSVCSQIDAGAVAALGITAQMCGTIPVDALGAPLHPCLIWLDTRSQLQAHRMTAGGPRVAGYGLFTLLDWLRLANGAPNLSGKDPASKMRWFHDNRPDLWNATFKFLDVKDWLVQQCTGVFATSEDLAQLRWTMDTRPHRRQWSAALARRVGVPLDKLPVILPSTQAVGSLTAQAAAHLGLRAGIPVACGVGDLNANALGSGDIDPGAWHLYVGSSSWVGCHTISRKVDPLTGIATICSAVADQYFLVATQENAGNAALWAAQVLGWGEGNAGLQALDRDAARCLPGDQTPLFVPWLHGERVPVDNAALRGAFVGMNPRTSREDLAYAVLAGVALNTRWAWDCARKLYPGKSGALRMLGGACESPIWPQIFADMLGHPVSVMENARWGGVRGAAMTAAVAGGLQSGLRDAASQTRIHHTCEPDPSAAAWANTRYAQLLGYYKATRRWHEFGLPPGSRNLPHD